MICANCGAEIPDDSLVCPICESEPIATVAAAVAEPAPAQSAANQATINYSKLSKAQYKDAKAAYKAARKAAGKSRAPLVVTCVILALVLAIGGAVAAWFYFNPKIETLNTENAELKTQVEKLTAENKELTDKLAEYEKGGNVTPSTDTDNPLIGAWKVDSFESTIERFACFGGKAKQASVRINIKEIDEANGTIKADLAVIYHAHDRSKLKADTDSSAEDAMLEYTDVEGVFADDAFTFELPVDNKYGNNSGIVVSGLMTTADANATMFGNQAAGSMFQLSVKSYYQSLTNAITDTYLMKN